MKTKKKLNTYTVSWTMEGSTQVRAASPEEAQAKWEDPDGPYHYKIWDSPHDQKSTEVSELNVDQVELWEDPEITLKRLEKAEKAKGKAA
jgi:hypothetical protein